MWYPDKTKGGNPQNHIFSPTITKLNQFKIILFIRETIYKGIITMLVKLTKVYYLQSSYIQDPLNPLFHQQLEGITFSVLRSLFYVIFFLILLQLAIASIIDWF